MDPILTPLIGYVAVKFFDQFVKDEGYGRLRRFLFPTQRYANRLIKVIEITIDRYERQDPNIYSGGKFAFYKLDIVFQSLMEFVLLEKHDKGIFIKQFERFPNCQMPSHQDLDTFFAFFYATAKADKKLKKLFIEENYQNRIFDISASLDELRETVIGLRDMPEKLDHIHMDLTGGESPVLAVNYVTRAEEDKLIGILESKNILLLTGISFCGKSQLAKRIADSFVGTGYKYQNRSDIELAERFLRNEREKRVFVLEDPFGHDSGSEYPGGLRRVEELVRNLPAENKLIITSRTEILKSINGGVSISDCSIENNSWVELNSGDRVFLTESWTRFSKELPASVISTIGSYIQNEPQEKLLQVGQLNHLANLSQEDLIGKDLEHLLHLAKADAKRLSVEISRRGHAASKLFGVLGLCCSTNIPVSIKAISYILSDSESFPGLQDDELISSRDFAATSEDAKMPVYEELFILPVEYQQELFFLKQRGFVSIADEDVYFSHPTYREAARYLLIGTDPLEVPLIESLLKKSIGCLSSDSAMHCTRQLDFLARNSQSGTLEIYIRKIALDAMRFSIFPGVRDLALIFALEHIEVYDNDDTSLVMETVYDGIPYNDIFWNGTVPFLSDAITYGRDEPLASAAFDKNISALANQEYLSTLDIWKTVQTINSNSFDVRLFPDQQTIFQILNSDEAFIRARIAFAVLTKCPGISEDILRAIFLDSHPSVVYEAIKGAFYSYPIYLESERVIIMRFLLGALTDKLIIIRSNRLLSNFGQDYGRDHIDWENIGLENKKSMWKLWSVAFPIFLSCMPLEISIDNSARFWATMEDSLDYVGKDSSILIADAFFQWASRRLASGIELDINEMGVMSYLIQAVSKGDSRTKLFSEILAEKKTGFHLCSVSSAINLWDLLDPIERSVFLALFQSERCDVRWIKAVALTRYKVPAGIQKAITGRTDIFELSPQESISIIGRDLLSDSLQIFYGHSHQVSALGLNDAGEQHWHPIVKWILINGHPTGYDGGLRDLVLRFINGPSGNWRHSGVEVWTSVCNNNSTRGKAADRLILECARCNRSTAPARQLWHILIASYPELDLPNLLAKIKDALEALQTFDARDILKFFDNKFLEQKILPEIPVDQSIFMTYTTLENKLPGYQATALDFLAITLAGIKVFKPKLQATFSFIQKLQQYADEIPAVVELVQIPNMIEQKGQDWLAINKENFVLQDWQ